MVRPTVFVDDGGVMNDNSVRGAEWRRLIGDFFVPRLGGMHPAWADANVAVMAEALSPDRWSRLVADAPDYASFDRAFVLAWIEGMCEHVGVPPPATVTERLALAAAADAWITRRVRSALAGAAGAIRQLHARGYTLHTASAASSAVLAGYLEGMGIRDYFGRLYGPDLVDAHKAGPAYYERIFVDAGVPPGDAIVVDDNEGPIAWAAAAGARTVLVGSATGEPDARIGSLAELPAIIDRLW